MCVAILLMGSVVMAQEDLGWITALLPDGDTIDIDKQLEQGALQVVSDAQILLQPFDAQNAWSSDTDRDGNRQVTGQRYEMRMRASDIIYTGLGEDEYTNTIITIDTERLSQEPNDGYGIVCRAEDDENGIHFYISSDGFWRIFAFEDGAARPFMPWTASEFINQGDNATNRITAVCVDEYFALYINGVLVGEAVDDTFSEGRVGMSVIVFEENSDVYIAFDDLRIWSASSIAGDLTTIDTTDNETVTTDSSFDEQRAATILQLEDAAEPLALNNLLLNATFEDDAETAWQIIERDGTVLIDDDVLTIDSEEDAQYPSMLLTSEETANVVVQATLTFEDGSDNNAYGLVCRAGANGVGRGYHFNISADGFYAVWVTDGDRFRFRVDWERNTAIEVNGSNQMTIVCVNDYFALYVNDVLMADFYDNTFLSGTVGLTHFTFEDDTSVTYDDFFVWDVSLQP